MTEASSICWFIPHSLQDWAKPKLGASNSIWVSQAGGRNLGGLSHHLLLPSVHISRKLELVAELRLKPGPLVWDAGVPVTPNCYVKSEPSSLSFLLLTTLVHSLSFPAQVDPSPCTESSLPSPTQSARAVAEMPRTLQAYLDSDSWLCKARFHGGSPGCRQTEGPPPTSK